MLMRLLKITPIFRDEFCKQYFCEGPTAVHSIDVSCLARCCAKFRHLPIVTTVAIAHRNEPRFAVLPILFP
jgi:hypothetical protein